MCIRDSVTSCFCSDATVVSVIQTVIPQSVGCVFVVLLLQTRYMPISWCTVFINQTHLVRHKTSWYEGKYGEHWYSYKVNMKKLTTTFDGGAASKLSGLEMKKKLPHFFAASSVACSSTITLNNSWRASTGNGLSGYVSRLCNHYYIHSGAAAIYICDSTKFLSYIR